MAPKECKELTELLFRIIWDKDKTEALTEEKINEMVEDYIAFIDRSSSKYIRGQVEHGGNIGDRDLDVEIDAEMDDLFFYHNANKRKKRNASAE